MSFFAHPQFASRRSSAAGGRFSAGGPWSEQSMDLKRHTLSSEPKCNTPADFRPAEVDGLARTLAQQAAERAPL
jgi:hypothetical protein